MSEYVVETKNIVKTFPGVLALNNVSFGVKAGEVHALVGENGAGKSTLMMVLGGIYHCDEGEIYVSGEQKHFSCARDAIEAGLGIVFQELSLVQQLSVAENIFFNRQPVSKLGFVDRKKLYDNAKEMLAQFDIETINPRTLVKSLSIANQQVVEILKAMSEKPIAIILDEPTSSLTEVEVQQLFKNIRRLKEQGIAFIYISHHLSEIFQIADTVTVLRDGEKIVTRKVSEIDEAFLISNMVGRSIENIYGKRTEAVGDVLFEAKGLKRKGVFEDISFNIRAGEIVGFSGLVGAGRTEVGRAIFGADQLDEGEISIDGKAVTITSPQKSIKDSIAYMTENRKALGLYLDFNILQNYVANKLPRFTRNGFLSESRMLSEGDKAIADYGIVATSARQVVSNLSGGNQQKAMLAQWFSLKPKLLIVDEPTRGVDVGAKCEIYELLRKIAHELQCAIMMISSDLPEILGLSDRIYVMKDGRIAGELGGGADEESVIRLAASSINNNAKETADYAEH